MSWQYNNLEVVGYADALSPEFLPRIVPPIYRELSGSSVFLFPPFQHQDDELISAVRAGENDFSAAVASEQATSLSRPVQARGGHLLWVNWDFSTHYGPQEDVRTGLLNYAKEASGQAMYAFQSGRYEDALRLSQFALNANDQCFDGVLIKALVYSTLGEVDKVKALTEIAFAINPSVNFASWIELYSEIRKKSVSRRIEATLHVLFYTLRGLLRRLYPHSLLLWTAPAKGVDQLHLSRFVEEALLEARKTARRSIPTI